MASDLVSNALSRAGYVTEYAQVPWERAVRGLRRSDYDVLINAWYSEERARFGYFSAPYLINRIRLLRRKGSSIQFEQLSDLYPYRIAVMRAMPIPPRSTLTRCCARSVSAASRAVRACCMPSGSS